MASSIRPLITVARIESVDPVLAHRCSDQDDEGAGRAADLKAAAADRRDEEAADDRRVEAALGRDARGDGDCHGQRQRNDGDGQSGKDVGLEVARVRSARAAP